MDAHSLECLDFYRVRELLAGYALTGLGRALAETIQPVARRDLVQRWLTQVQELQLTEQERGLPPMGGITDVRDVVRRCGPPLRVSVEEVARVGDALAGSHAVATYLAGVPAERAELQHLAERVGDFRTIADRIRAVIDERGRARDDASPKLSRIRREIDDASAKIRTAVERLLHDPNVRRLLQFPNYTFHGDRMVLPVRTEYRGRLPGIVHRGSDSGATLYVEPAIAVELNNRISNLRAHEAEEVARLLWELTHEIYINTEPILKTLDALAVLDLVIAKIRFARDFGLRCPELDEHSRLSVRQARHPLLVDMFRRRAAQGEDVGEVVPISYRLGEDFNLLIITGPNTGGKTVTLKTVGLISLMLQAGMPVPVGEGSTFGIFRNVLIDIGDEQNMQQSLSTFSAHLTRQLDMLRRAGPQTLVLIDELGAGTDPDEGAAIGQALLDELLKLDCRCIVTTHIGALKGFALQRQGVENGCVDFDEQTLRPTYHLRIGEPGMSNALAIAQRLGMPRRLVAAAKRNVSGRNRALHTALEGTISAKRSAEAARAALDKARLDAHRAYGEADAARLRLEKQSAEFQAWVARVVHLQPGDPVRVRNFDRDGRILRVRIDLQRAEVDVGPFAVEVPLGDVLPPQTPAPPPRPPRPPRPAAVHAGETGAVAASKAGNPRERGRRSDTPRGPRPEASQGSRPDAPHGSHPDAAHGSRQAGPPAGQRGGPQHGREGDRRPQRPREHPPERPRPVLPSLTDEQAAALEAGDLVYAKRFHREAKVVRLKPAKKVAVVSVGLLEVELPFNGLALVPVEQPAPPRRRPRPENQPAGRSPNHPAASESHPESGEGRENGPDSAGQQPDAPAGEAPNPQDPAQFAAEAAEQREHAKGSDQSAAE